MRARYYSPELRRFINTDPIGFAGGLNWFTYVGGNPISFIDPNGNLGIGSTMLAIQQNNKRRKTDGLYAINSGVMTADAQVSLADVADRVDRRIADTSGTEAAVGLAGRGFSENDRFIQTGNPDFPEVDLVHSTSAAGTTLSTPFSIGVVAHAGGLYTELTQLRDGDDSAFSPEDLPSNSLGVRAAQLAVQLSISVGEATAILIYELNPESAKNRRVCNGM
jgi:hypothetical protein